MRSPEPTRPCAARGRGSARSFCNLAFHLSRQERLRRSLGGKCSHSGASGGRPLCVPGPAGSESSRQDRRESGCDGIEKGFLRPEVVIGSTGTGRQPSRRFDQSDARRVERQGAQPRHRPVFLRHRQSLVDADCEVSLAVNAPARCVLCGWLRPRRALTAGAASRLMDS